MTNKQILEEVHKMARTHIDQAANESVHNHTAKLIASFIEEEWQRQDEQQQSTALGQFSQTWYQVDGGREDKRHRELEIGEDGTVKKIL